MNERMRARAYIHWDGIEIDWYNGGNRGGWGRDRNMMYISFIWLPQTHLCVVITTDEWYCVSGSFMRFFCWNRLVSLQNQSRAVNPNESNFNWNSDDNLNSRSIPTYLKINHESILPHIRAQSKIVFHKMSLLLTYTVAEICVRKCVN